MKYPVKPFLFLLLFLGLSCQDDDTPKIYESGTNQYANQWVYQQMQRYYYWNENMPGEGDLSLNPKEYFAQLLDAQDRFSYMLHPSLAETYPKSIRGTFGFDIAFVEHQGQVYGLILYVLSDSAAQNSGLHRGDYISAINGTVLNQANYAGLYQDLTTTTEATIDVVNYNQQSGFSAPHQVAISQRFIFLQPLLHRIITQGNNTVGYIEIPHFDVGLSALLLQAFQDFKSHSVNKIVVDLRYNGGGDVSSATALSIILAPDIQANDLFITFKGNQNGGNVPQSFQQALEMNETQVSFEELRSAHPPIQQLYLLCGNHTASASEIIINNLKPFMEVVTIGQKTVGKDVAGFPVEDDRVTGTIGWTLYPSIYKLFNADNQGGYSAGIAPAIEVNELQSLHVLPLGDSGEVLLTTALNIISGNGRMLNSPGIQILPSRHAGAGADPLLLINP